jgi:hypothetical protein
VKGITLYVLLPLGVGWGGRLKKYGGVPSPISMGLRYSRWIIGGNSILQTESSIISPLSSVNEEGEKSEPGIEDRGRETVSEAGGLGAALRPQWVQDQTMVGGPGGKAHGSS